MREHETRSNREFCLFVISSSYYYYYYCHYHYHYHYHYSEHKDAIHKKSSITTSKRESDILFKNMDKSTYSSAPCYGEGPSVWDSSEHLNDRNVCFLEDHAASKSFQDYTEVASLNAKVDNGNKAVSQWKTLEQISPLQIHKTLDLTGSTKGYDRPKSTQRTYPVNVKSKIPVQICKQYASGMERKESGAFANGHEELTLRTMQQGRGRQYWTEMQTVLRHIKLL